MTHSSTADASSSRESGAAGPVRPDPDPADPAAPPVTVAPATAEPKVTPAAAEPTAAAALAEPTPPKARARAAQAITAFSSAAALVWIVAVALSAGHGFDTSDEGYYLLSYRWWSVNGRTFTGVQYLYGPVFQALGYDIAGLRLFRLLTVVASLGAFGWCFMRWLRTRRPAATASRWWEAAGTATIVAAGGAMYGWLPLSPGYNDVSLLGALLCMAIVFRTAAATQRAERVPAWVAVAAGPVILAMLLAKWSSSMIVILVAAVALLVVLWPRGWREVLRFIAWTLAGLVVAALLVHVLIVSLTDAVPQMLEVNKIVAGRTNSPAKLLRMYADTSARMLRNSARTHWLLMIAMVVAALAGGRRTRGLALALGALALAVSAWQMVHEGGLTGGTLSLRRYPASLTAVVLAALVAVIALVASRRRGSLARAGGREWFLLAVLLAVPYLQALGTGNAIHVMAINGYALWIAAVIAVVTGMDAAPAGRAVLAAAVAGSVAAAATIGLGGSLLHPYRTEPFARTVSAVAGAKALSSVRLDPATAAKYADLHAKLAPYLFSGRAIMAFDEMAGVVLMLDGRPVGEAWYSASDHSRTAAGIRAVCAGGKPWWGDQRPLLIFRRPVGKADLNALQSCGLDIASDYRRLAPPAETMGLTVYTPKEQA